ncbi:carboxypeptidase-like regulatory domain-containing protein [Sphingobacterium multivorum]|uniref:carboxypeptidase-like regulatory domain-containing protein n=1 Tax=Sphingobacterium multivorum TaxID=28454 RepID=UPI0028A5EAE3|nr:carboxypeptidase-like regulatory domain-containing protein [Sphingobacterium multivorum]
MKSIVIIIFVALAGMKGLIAQTTLLGKVFDTDTHRPLSHCTIKVGGEANVLVTDEGGLFSLKTDKPTVVLTITYTGYKKKEIQVDLPQKEMLLIPMGKEIMALEEVSVINTGYQNIPKERATGSFEHIDSALFNRRVGPDVLSRLEGVTGSLLVDKRNADQVKLQIRGVSTLYASDDPLIILDNFPYEGYINNINPNDIASVSVLKDAAAASIWGARAGNGVIVLTSKKGRYNQSVHLDLNTNLTIAQKPNLFNIPIMSTPDYIEAQKFLFKNGFYDNELND